MIPTKPNPSRLIDWVLKNKVLSAFAIACLACLLQLWSAEMNASAPTNPKTLETLIPQGFQLIPIEVANQESLDSVFGQYGYVDLYAADVRSPTPSKRIVQAVKLLRAPLNPQQFAVLVRSDLASDIVRHGPSYFVVVQNLTKPQTFVETVAPQAHSRIVVEGK